MKDGLKILVGTRGSEIVEFKISSKYEVDDDEVDIITRGHFKDEVWGLVVDKAKKPKPILPAGMTDMYAYGISRKRSRSKIFVWAVLACQIQ